jgi:uncharacterized membrane protein YbhN (UPF0104 family)
MSSTAASPPRAGGRPRLRRLLEIAGTVVVIGGIAYLLGWDIRGWFHDLWNAVTSISAASLVAGIVLVTLQTVFTAEGWLWILRYGYPDAHVGRKEIVACYAASVALNNVLPANLGTVALLFMFTAIVAGATFSGILGGFVVQKIFFTVAGTFVYLYLFLSVGGSFDIKFSWIHEHPWATLGIVAGVVVLVLVLVRAFRPRVAKLWEQAKEGGQVLVHPRAYLGRVVLPSFLGWCASLGVIAVFLNAYGIPVSFHTVMRIVGGNSIANTVTLTPGGVGVNQAFNVASLNGVASTSEATAYSVGQQLVTTAWNIVFAIVMLVWAFGWSGGRELVETSYADAKERAAEEKEKRKEKKAAAAGEGT